MRQTGRVGSKAITREFVLGERERQISFITRRRGSGEAIDS